MSGDMRVRLLLELVNRLSGPARQAATDVKSVGAAAKAIQGAGAGKLEQDLRQAGVAAKGARAALAEAGAAARSVGQSADARPLQQALAGVADQARRADGALDATAAAAREVGRSGNALPLQQSLAGVADRARQADGALGATATAARRLDGAGPRALARALAGIPTAGSRSAEAMAAIAREANRLARVGPGQALRRDLAQAAREARRTHDALAELTRGVQRLERRGPGQALRRDLAQIAREARRADDALNGVANKAQRLQQANIGSAMQRGLANIATEAERTRRALAATNAEAARTGRRAPSGAGSVQPGEANPPAEMRTGDEGGGTSIVAAGKNMLLMGGAAYTAREVVRQTVGQSIRTDTAMADIKKKVDLPEGRDWSDIEREIDKAAMTYGRSRNEVAAMAANLGASGIAFDDLPRYIGLAIKSGVAWDMPANESSAELMKVYAGLGWRDRQLEEYGDKVNALGDASNALERNIVEAFGRSVGAAKASGVSEDVTLAGVTALQAVGVQPEIASRFFSQFSAKLAMASSDDPKKWKAAGLDSKAVTAGMRTDSFNTMVKVLEQISTKANAAELAVEIFGEGWWDESMRLARAIPEWKRLVEILNDPGKWKGSQQKALDIELATTQNHLDRLWATIEKVGDAFGRWTLAPINAATDALSKGIESLDGRASIFEATMERIRAAAALDAGHDVAGGERKPIELPDKPVIDIKGETETEKKFVSWLSGGESNRKFVSEYAHDVIFGREGEKEQRLAEARLQALRDHQQKLDEEVGRAVAAETEIKDKLARLRHERAQRVSMGIDTNAVDYQIGRAENELSDRTAAAETARENRRAHDQKMAAARAKAGPKNARFALDFSGFRQQSPSPVTRDIPNKSDLKIDGLPAVVGGFDTVATKNGVRAGYTEKPVPRSPTTGWHISKDEAGGFELPEFPALPDFSRRRPATLDVPASKPIVLPQRPDLPKFGFGATGAARQPEQRGGAGAPTSASMRAVSLQEMFSPPDLGATIMERLAADIDAGRPKVEGSAQAVGDGLRNVLFGADLAPAGQAAMDSYAAGITANGGKAVAAAQAVSAQVQSALRVDMSGAVSGGGSTRGRIGGSLHDIPTGGP